MADDTVYTYNGTQVPRVTHILQILNKPHLTKWANAMGFKRMNIAHILEDTAAIGTEVHFLIRVMVMRGIWVGAQYTDQQKNVLRPYMENFTQKIFNVYDIEPDFMERSFSCSRYGGTVDFYGDVDGIKTLLDFKTSSKPHGSMFLQLAAYYKMLISNGYKVDRVGICIVNAKTAYIHFMEAERLELYVEIFEIMVSLFTKWRPISIEDGWGDVV